MLQEYLRRIEDLVPELKVEHSRLISEWYDNDVIEINKELMFRFSKENKKFVDEIQLLLLLWERLWEKITYPTYVGRDKNFFGYQKITWDKMSNEVINWLSADAHNNLVDNLAEYMRKIHTTDVPLSINIPIYHKAHNFRYDYGLHEKNLSSVSDKVRSLFESVRAWRNTWSVEIPETYKWLLHNDLYYNNILVSKHWIFQWCIDISDYTYWDIHLEFMSLYLQNPLFTRDLMLEYQQVSNLELDRDIIKLYGETFILAEYFGQDVINNLLAKEYINNLS